MDYIDRDKKKKLKENLIKLLITLLVFLILILSYIVYESVQVSEKKFSRKQRNCRKNYANS